jgi:hypothetical protein
LDILDDAPDGLSGPPSNWRSGDVRGAESGHPCRTIRLHTDNDAFALDGYLVYDDEPPGTDHRVAFSFSRSEAHRLAWWIVRWWAAEWFGLRRWLYYWALTKHLDIVAPNRHGPPR